MKLQWEGVKNRSKETICQLNATNGEIPRSFDWREKGVVTMVKVEGLVFGLD